RIRLDISPRCLLPRRFRSSLFLHVALPILLVVDSRIELLGRMRQGIATVLYPVQRTLLVPRALADVGAQYVGEVTHLRTENAELDRKSTRLNSSHVKISYAVFCLLQTSAK